MVYGNILILIDSKQSVKLTQGNMGFENKDTAKKAGQKSRRGKSEKTKEWDALSDAITEKHAKKFN